MSQSCNYRFIQNISDVSAERWNSLLSSNYPFLRHEFLHALEASDSVNAERGWQPQHLLIEDTYSKALLATLPLYIKTHSYGEYVFDWSWADAYRRHGLVYYPKLISAVPFTPATGPRISYNQAIDPAMLINTINLALKDKTNSISGSGWHVLFPQQDELKLWEQSDAEIRLGCQFHWQNDDYEDFDAFLTSFTSRKRKDVRKERKRITQHNIEIRRLVGDEITLEHWQQFYHFYQLTYAKKSGHGGYLTPEFFMQLHNTMCDQLLLVMAYENGQAIAGALSFFDDEILYGRYWGTLKDIDCLHFEVCFYQGIEFCIENKLKRFDPGAQGEHKISRGFVPTITYSYHSINHPEFRKSISEFLSDEAVHIQQYQTEAARLLPFKNPGQG